MMRKQLSGVMLIAAAITLVVLEEWAPGGLYTFGGHGREVNQTSHALTWLLFFTHAMLAFIMWQQRDDWDHAEAATFRFIGAKGEFWCWAAVTFKPQNGIDLGTVFLLLFLFTTTLDLDFALINRYAFRRGAKKTDKARFDRWR